MGKKKKSKKAKSVGCGVIDGCMSMNGGRITFGEHDFTVDGGFWHGVSYETPYSDVTAVWYTRSLLPKIKFDLRSGKTIPKLRVLCFRLGGILKIFLDRDIAVRPYRFFGDGSIGDGLVGDGSVGDGSVGDGLVRWWRFWYGEWIDG